MTDFSLYIITDRQINGKRSILKSVSESLSAGANILQMREKKISTAEMMSLGQKLQKIAAKFKVPFIINDRIDVALALQADGVHVGQDDMPAALARRLIGRKKILGVSAKNVKQAKKAERDGADYIGVGDVFGTTSKDDAGKPIGLPVLRQIVKSVKIPVVGIGAISKTNAASVIQAGADGIAVISAVFGAGSPKKATLELMQIINSSKNK